MFYTDRVIAITGGTSGIGLATARHFIDRNANVAIMGRNQDRLNQALALLGDSAVGIKGDVSNIDDLRAFYAVIKEKFGYLDVVFANAGMGYSAKLFENLSYELIDSMVQTNIIGTIATVKESLPLLLDGGAIVINSSLSAEKAIPGHAIYTMVKRSLEGLTIGLASDLAYRKIRVNAVRTGFIETNFIEACGVPKETAAYQREMAVEDIPLNRLGQGEDIAEIVEFLAFKAKFVTATIVGADGGQLACGMPQLTASLLRNNS